MSAQFNRDEELHELLKEMGIKSGEQLPSGKEMRSMMIKLATVYRTHDLQAISHYSAIPEETLRGWINDYKGDE